MSEQAAEDFKRLKLKVQEERQEGINNSDSQQLLKSIENSIARLLTNPQSGLHIKRINIPTDTKKRYGTDRLWKMNLAGYWRMIYTLTGDQLRVISFILEFMNHKQYNKRFKYKKK